MRHQCWRRNDQQTNNLRPSLHALESYGIQRIPVVPGATRTSTAAASYINLDTSKEFEQDSSSSNQYVGSTPQPVSASNSAEQQTHQPSALKPTWSSGPAVMRRIQSTRSITALKTILDENRLQLNHIHISASMVHLTRIAQAESKSFPAADRETLLFDGSSVSLKMLVKYLLGLTLQQLEYYDVQGISNTLHSLAVFQYHDEAVLYSLLTAVQYRLDSATPQNLSNIMWACVCLDITPERDWMSMYYSSLDKRVEQFGPQDIANTLWAFGRLEFEGSQYRVAQDSIGRLLQQSYHQLANFTAQQLSNSLWGLARLGFAPNPTWMQVFVSVSQSRLNSMEAAELCSVVWAASKLQLAVTPSWLEAAIQATEQALPSLTSTQLSQLLSGLGSLGAQPSATWMANVLQASQIHATTTSPAALALTLRGLAKLGGVSSLSSTHASSSSSVADSTHAFHRDSHHLAPSASSATDGLVQEWFHSQLDRAVELMGPLTPSTPSTPQDDAVHQETQQRPNRMWRRQRQKAGLLTRWRSLSQENEAGPSAIHLSAEVNGHSAHAVSSLSQQSSVASYDVSSSSSSSDVSGSDDDSVSAYQGSCQFTAVELAHVLHSLARIGLKPPKSWLSHVAGVIETTPGLVESAAADSRTLSMLLWGFMQLWDSRSSSSQSEVHAESSLHASTDSISVQPVVTQMNGNTNSQTPEHSTSSLGVLHMEAPTSSSIGLPAPLLQRLMSVTVGCLKDYGPSELAVLLRAVASQPALTRSQGANWLTRYWWQSLVLLGKGDFNPAAIVQHLSCLHTLQVKPHAAWWKGVQRSTARQFRQFDGHHFSRLASYMCAMGHSPPPSYVRRFFVCTYYTWSSFKPQHWTMLLSAIAKMKVDVPASWTLRVVRTIRQDLGSYSAQQLSFVGWALGRLKGSTSYGSGWSRVYQEATLPLLSSMSANEVTRTVCAVANTAAAPSREWVQAALQAMRVAAASGSLKQSHQAALQVALRTIKRKLARQQKVAAASTEETGSQASQVLRAVGQAHRKKQNFRKKVTKGQQQSSTDV